MVAVGEFGPGAVVRVDPRTGDRTLVSGCTGITFQCTASRGSGPSFRSSPGIAVEANGQLVVVDRFRQAVVRVDRVTGDRRIVSQGATGRGGGPPFAGPQGVAVEVDGHLVVADGIESVLRVDRVTGDRTLVSGCVGFDPETFQCRGSGQSTFGEPQGIAVEADGSLVVAVVVGFGSSAAVVRVDRVTGDRTLVSGCTEITFHCTASRGSGPSLREPQGIAVEADGSLVVAVGIGFSFSATVVRVDPRTGDRTVVSGCTNFDRTTFQCTASRGSGPSLREPRGIAVEADGSLVVAVDEFGLEGVVRVDPRTGDRTIVSGASTGRGPALLQPAGVAVEDDGSLVVADGSFGLRAVVRVDPHTGDRTVVSGCADFDRITRECKAIVGRGQPFEDPAGIAVEADGHLVVVDRDLRAVVRVDPATGDRTLVSR
ncbi:MAG: hypothetical protein HYZ81_20750 [Nitrospinae bacterium]|nr:hypothetical protein [Nitrospinota bacterium]